MSLTYSNWLSGTLTTAAQRTARAQERAADAWQRINDNGATLHTIVLRTAAGVNRAAQVVRIELDNRSGTAESDAGTTPRMNVIIYGVRSHATLSDTVMAEGDRFVLNGDAYTIEDVILQQGEIQGIGVATG